MTILCRRSVEDCGDELLVCFSQALVSELREAAHGLAVSLLLALPCTFALTDVRKHIAKLYEQQITRSHEEQLRKIHHLATFLDFLLVRFPVVRDLCKVKEYAGPVLATSHVHDETCLRINPIESQKLTSTLCILLHDVMEPGHTYTLLRASILLHELSHGLRVFDVRCNSISSELALVELSCNLLCGFDIHEYILQGFCLFFIQEAQVNADNFLLFLREKLVTYVPGSFRIEPTHNRHNRPLYVHLQGPAFGEVQRVIGLNLFVVALHAYIICSFCLMNKPLDVSQREGL